MRSHSLASYLTPAPKSWQSHRSGKDFRAATIQGTLAGEMIIPDKKEMQTRVRASAIATICVFLAVGLATFAYTRAHSPIQSASRNGAPVTKHATGPFDVKVAPQGDADKAEGSTLARYSLDKQYHGDLEATASGTMLTAGTDVKGSAGYVAIERVTGKLNGLTGSFVLQHSGTLTRGAPAQSITVVPDSGTGQLTGIAGTLTIIIDAGKHSYAFDYTIPGTP
jgi:hypothetical protein